VRIGQQEKAGGHRDEPARVKQAVRHEPDGQRGLVIEVMPVQQLVEYRLVDERHQAYAGQHPDQMLRLGSLAAASPTAPARCEEATV
jgi:hypothetical protein